MLAALHALRICYEEVNMLLKEGNEVESEPVGQLAVHQGPVYSRSQTHRASLFTVIHDPCELQVALVQATEQSGPE